LSYILNNKGPTIPPDSCVTNWRVFHYSCWEMRSKVVLNPCQDSVCCMAKYKVCTDDDGEIIVFERIDFIPPPALDCVYVTHPCIFMCFIDPYVIGSE
jgi:hypothetical protein